MRISDDRYAKRSPKWAPLNGRRNSDRQRLILSRKLKKDIFLINLDRAAKESVERPPYVSVDTGLRLRLLSPALVLGISTS